MLRKDVFEKLKVIEEQSGEAGLAENIDQSICDGHSFLFQNDHGFIVASLAVEEKETFFVVNAAWCKTGRGHKDYHNTVELLAKHAKCAGIRFSTTRIAYPRFAKKYGYHVERQSGSRIYLMKRFSEQEKASG